MQHQIATSIFSTLLTFGAENVRQLSLKTSKQRRLEMNWKSDLMIVKMKTKHTDLFNQTIVENGLISSLSLKNTISSILFQLDHKLNRSWKDVTRRYGISWRKILFRRKAADSRWSLIDLVAKNFQNSCHARIRMTQNEKLKIVSQKKIEKLNKYQEAKSNLVLMNRKPIINSSAELEVRIKKVKKNPLDKSRGYNNWSHDI